MNALYEEIERLKKENAELKARLAEDDVEPVAWWSKQGTMDFLTFERPNTGTHAFTPDWGVPLYIHPARKLSDDEIFNIGFSAGFKVDWSEPYGVEEPKYGFLDECLQVDNDSFFKFARSIEAKIRGCNEPLTKDEESAEVLGGRT